MGGARHTSDWASLLCRLFSWAVLRFLNCLLLNVQLHQGHLKMVREAAHAVSSASSGVGQRGRARPSPKSGPAPCTDGKRPPLFDDLPLTFSSCLMGLLPWSFPESIFILVLTTIHQRVTKGCRQSSSPSGKCSVEELSARTLRPSGWGGVS